MSDAAALMLFLGSVLVIGAIHARERVMRRTAIGRSRFQNVRTPSRNAFADSKTRNRNVTANRCGTAGETRGVCPRCDGSGSQGAEALRALATPVRRRELEPLDWAASIIVPAVVILCWALLTLLVIGHERETERQERSEVETESVTRT